MKIKEILILLILIFPTMLALLMPGFYGASDDMHIAWLQQMDQAIMQEQIPPRYIADVSYGFGYPLFNFIFPLPYYLGEVFHLAGLAFVASIKAVFLFSIITSAMAMYVLAKHFSGKLVGMAAAVLYIYSPYRSTDIYVRGALGEALAFVFLPLIIYFLIRVGESAKKEEIVKWTGLGALSVSGLILTHNIVSYMFIPFAIIFGLVILRKKLKELYSFFFLGLIGSIYFWFPALLDSKLMKYETVFNYFDHFPSIRQLITPYWGYGASVPGNYDLMSFFVGEVNLIVVALVISILIISYKKLNIKYKQIIYWVLTVVAVAVLMMNYRSSGVWEVVPLIKYFQFPWRFLTLIVFGTSLLVVVVKNFKYSKYIALLIIVASIAFNAGRFKPYEFLLRGDDYYIKRYIPVPIPSQEYLGLEEEYLRLPKSTVIRPKNVYTRLFPENSAIYNVTEINSLDTNFKTESDSMLILNYNKYYFPGWEGTIDGEKLVLGAGKPYGQIQFTVPEGNHDVTIRYRETKRNRILDWISLITIFGCIYAATKIKKVKVL